MLIGVSDAFAAGNNMIWATGLLLVNDAAFNAGSAAIPDPLGDDAEWLWIKQGYLYSEFDSNSGIVLVKPRYIEIDSKAKRKMAEEEQRLVWVFTNSSSSGSTIPDVGIAIRTLVLLP